jgi:hypothetical protein
MSVPKKVPIFPVIPTLLQNAPAPTAKLLSGEKSKTFPSYPHPM